MRMIACSSRDPVLPSTPRRCARCGVRVWISDATADSAEKDGARIYCYEACAPELIAQQLQEHGEVHLAATPETIAEVEAELDRRRGAT